MSQQLRPLHGPQGEVVTHKRITRFPDTTTCTGTMQRVFEAGSPVGSNLDHIAVCSLCGAEYAVQTGTGKAVRDGQINREEAA